MVEIRNLEPNYRFAYSQLHSSAFAQPQSGQLDFWNAKADALGSLALSLGNWEAAVMVWGLIRLKLVD